MNEVVIGVSIVILVLYLIISLAACSKFSEIAAMKGHDKSTYYCWCFFCGIIGMMAVIALPDRNIPKNRSGSHNTYKSQPNPNDELPDL